jgi:hypothetical protein
MKVLIKNFDTGFKKIAQVDQDYFKRQSKIISSTECFLLTIS